MIGGPRGPIHLSRTALLMRYLREKLADRSTYVTALVVGTLINAYGHLLVPWMRGHDAIVAGFVEEFRADPGLVGFSVALGYIFPVLVGVYASVRTRWRHRHEESRALFPDQKPDPVFRAAADGTIVESGEATTALFDRHQVRQAQDILGPDVWRSILEAARAGASSEAAAQVYFPPEDGWYLVGHSPAPHGQLNVYLTRVSPSLVHPPTPRESP